MLFLIALDMVFEKRTERREDRAEKVGASRGRGHLDLPDGDADDRRARARSPAVMLLMCRNHGLERSRWCSRAMATILVLTLLALLAAGPLMRMLGAKIEAVITRLLGVLLAALAVQFVIDGIWRGAVSCSGLQLRGTEPARRRS